MEVTEVPITSWRLLPARPGTCPECAVEHPPDQPHNQQSLYYQYHFFFANGRWPTWMDAMRHCDYKTRNLWVEQLDQMGVTVIEVYRNWGNLEGCLPISK